MTRDGTGMDGRYGDCYVVCPGELFAMTKRKTEPMFLDRYMLADLSSRLSELLDSRLIIVRLRRSGKDKGILDSSSAQGRFRMTSRMDSGQIREWKR